MFKILTMNTISDVYKQFLPADEYEVGPDVKDPDAILLRSADLHTYEVNPNLKCVARAGAGVNNIPIEEFGEKGIVVFNTPGANSNAVKELAVAGMLMASRDIVGGIAWARTLAGKGDEIAKLVEKGKSQFAGPELMGKKLGVIGLGAIGAQFANAGKALNMDVYGFDPYITVDHAWMLSRAINRVKSQDELLAQCDYVSVHVPLLPTTKGMVNAEFIAKMKKGAVLLNFARGDLAVEADVLAALDAGQLRAYVTDFPSDALLVRDKVICTPHLGASTPESEDNCVEMAARQIDAYLKRGAIVNSVNFPVCELSVSEDGKRMTILHANMPNVVSSITNVMGEDGLNIDNMVNMSKGRFAYTVLHTDDQITENSLRKMRSLDTVYGARAI